jgi:hypothetical protein
MFICSAVPGKTLTKNKLGCEGEQIFSADLARQADVTGPGKASWSNRNGFNLSAR